MDDAGARDTGRLAMVVGAVAAGSAVSLAAYFTVQGPFGTINDLGNATTGVLSGWLAWRLRGLLPGRSGDIAVGAALAGAATTVVGSALVVSGTTGFLFAGLVSSVGFAGIGAWLVSVNRSAAGVAVWPDRLRMLGTVAGALMAIGIVAIPGIPLGLDDMATAPVWVWVGFVGWLGIYVLYPAWALLMGTTQTRPVRRAAVSAAVVEPDRAR